MASSEITLEAVPDISDIPAAEWDACANPKGDPDSPDNLDTLASIDPAGNCEAISKPGYNPFVSHAFLAAAEASNSACARTGWGPRHLVAKLDDEIVAVVPCYLKSHSQGEYVFDRGWAEAYHRAGGSYYPKLQVSVPFTPATGPRLLIRDGVDRELIGSALARGLRALCNATEASSVHVTFAREDEAKFLGEHGFLQRTDQQFHWHNAGFATFDDFLATLNSRHRKAIKRERREAVAAGITIDWLTGSEITEEAWDAFFEFYMETGSRKWGRPYLTRKFFSLIGESMSQDVLLVMAKRNGRWIAGAINFIGSDTLFGRNWGAIEHHPFLHFEVCYYQAIDFAIQHGLKIVEAGAQGEHKLARGYLPQTTYSAHFIADPALRRAIADYLKRERAYVAEVGRELTEAGPFRKTADDA
ncbi:MULTISPECIES: GNAT family N-acetyltransferase [unclassified Bradyrhizobium]|uniref:GNAT family N-acetyltransferase n=1 Tax=unclassified Bradyrhizobium TaxID=2631580 RepID=UPI0024798201|nr:MULTISPECIES: GNAT family N-acetyltransferase [unclassified Bradyrhizobium]WGS23595.1 GNAT family N-acetyltransferase [Bradyrhizobium sp. ISRA463]WGS30619.1 GNAT family N-acetyltransferase [Bradyrhizobium sp. ISRA464]